MPITAGAPLQLGTVSVKQRDHERDDRLIEATSGMHEPSRRLGASVAETHRQLTPL